MAGEQSKSNFFEQIEACRPGSDDLRGEDFALAAEQIAQNGDARRHYERVQLADSRMAMAFHDVPVPEGLADRLLAAIDAAAPAALAPVVDPDHPPAAREVDVRPSARPRRTALRWAAAASLVAVIGAVWALVSTWSPYSNEQCLAAASQAGAQLKAERWTSIKATPAPDEREPQTRLRGAVKSWQPVVLLGDEQAVAYRYTNGATLLVCRPNKPVSALPSAPPATPQQKAQQSSDTHIGMWVSGDLVHVLLVSGPIEEYRRMTGTTRPVVAFVRPQGLPNRYDG